MPAAKHSEHRGSQRADPFVQPSFAWYFQYRPGCDRNGADPVRVYFLCIPVQFCAGRSVRLSERLWRFLHPGGLCGHRNLRGTAHMDIHCVPADAVLYNDHAGISSQPGNNSGSHPGCNAVGKAVKTVCSPGGNIPGCIENRVQAGDDT